MAIKSIKAGNNIFIGSSKLKTAIKTIKRRESR
jgi:hypothetical protein